MPVQVAIPPVRRLASPKSESRRMRTGSRQFDSRTDLQGRPAGGPVRPATVKLLVSSADWLPVGSCAVTATL